MQVWRDPFGGLSVAESLGEDWVASYRFLMQNGTPVLAELRILRAKEIRPDEMYPIRKDQGPDELERTLPGGLTWSRIQRMRPRALLEAMLGGWEEDVRQTVGGTPFGDTVEVEVPGGGWASLVNRWMRGDRSVPAERKHRLLLVAALYAMAVTQGRRRVNEEIGQHLGRKPTQVRDDIYAARVEGYLTQGSGRGRPSGELTAKAIEMIEGQEEQ